jgi:hypothetical protein
VVDTEGFEEIKMALVWVWGLTKRCGVGANEVISFFCPRRLRLKKKGFFFIRVACWRNSSKEQSVYVWEDEIKTKFDGRSKSVKI